MCQLKSKDSKEESLNRGLDHPETFIRARALRLWADGDADLDAWLKKTIEAPAEIDALDLTGQCELEKLTRPFLAELLRPKWFRSPAILAHAKASWRACAWAWIFETRKISGFLQRTGRICLPCNRGCIRCWLRYSSR